MKISQTSVFLHTPPLIIIRGMVKSEVQKASENDQLSIGFRGCNESLLKLYRFVSTENQVKKATWRRLHFSQHSHRVSMYAYTKSTKFQRLTRGHWA